MSPTVEDCQKIVDVLVLRSLGKEGGELVLYIYNRAIDDCAKFISDLVPHNPMQATTLMAASEQIKELRLRVKE